MYSRMPRLSHRLRSSTKLAYACSALAPSAWARLMRYEPCGRTWRPASYEWESRRARNSARCSSERGGDSHFRWDLRKRAKALAPIFVAFWMELWTPRGRS